MCRFQKVDVFPVTVSPCCSVIASFADAATEDLFHGRPTARARRFPVEVARLAVRKLDALNAATGLDDLRSPPGQPARGPARRSPGAPQHPGQRPVADRLPVAGCGGERRRLMDYHS